MNKVDNMRSLPIRGLTREQMNDKRRKKICFSCDEPYVQGHVCKRPQLFLLLLSDQDALEESEQAKCTEEETSIVSCEEPEAQITLHALSGHSNTVRLLGMANGKFLRFLVDSVRPQLINE